MNKLHYPIILVLFFSINTFSQEKIEAPFDITIEKTSFPEKYFSIVEYGAIEGGTEKCTKAIADAIDNATKAGGGYVIVPKGKWLTGPIVLKDNVCVKFEDGTEILFSTDTDDYLPAVLSRHQGIDCYKHCAFIYANNATNIGVIGKAILHGQGKTWWQYRNALPQESEHPFKKLEKMAEQGVPVEERVFDDINNTLLAPCFVMPINCNKVLIEGITCRYGAYWTVNPVYCTNVIIRNVTVKTIGEYGKTGNGDGINLSSCKNALIEDCTLDTGDDCITLKSGRNIDGYKKGMPTQNIVVRNCKSLKGHGGVVIGSETSGGIRNIYIHDCVFNGTDRGLRIKTARTRGDVIENVWFENIKMGAMIKEVIKIHVPRYTKRYPAHELTRMTPRIRNINYKNIECEGAGTHAIRITGVPEMPVESVKIENLKAKSKLGIQVMDAASITLKNIEIETPDSNIVIVDNCKNMNIENLNNNDKNIKIIGENTNDIRFIDCDIDKNKIQYTNCENKVSLFVSKRK